jgi:hypothetical protein
LVALKQAMLEYAWLIQERTQPVACCIMKQQTQKSYSRVCLLGDAWALCSFKLLSLHCPPFADPSAAPPLPPIWTNMQVGPCLGMDGGDHMWMSRFLLARICEIYNVEVTFDPKPIPGTSEKKCRVPPGGRL